MGTVRCRIASIFCLLTIAVAPSMARAADSHCDHHSEHAAEPLGILYRSSAFLHGFRHGYETGFYQADADLHLAHVIRDAKRYRSYRVVPCQSETDGRKQYIAGFRAGFATGLDDMNTNRDFRLFELLSAVQREGELNPAVVDRDFDAGLEQGYRYAIADLKASNIKAIATCTPEKRTSFCRGVRSGEALAETGSGTTAASASLHSIIR